MNSPLLRPTLSVLIPVRNRAQELESLVSLINDCSPSDVEFVISDNSDSPLDLHVTNPACRVVRPNEVLNMTENWNFVLLHSLGKYVTFLGDDDALIPSELDQLVTRLANSDTDIVWHHRATYAWPDQAFSGNFYQELKLRGERATLDKQRARVLSLDYTNLPIPYHDALVHRKVLERFWSTKPQEAFFGSRTPDYNAGAKILWLAETQIDYNRTVFISGASPTSNGGLTWSNPQHPRAREFTNLERNPPPKWVPRIEMPIGFFWLHEAVEEALLLLEVSHKTNLRKLCFLSINQSQNPRIQFYAAKLLWPNLVVIRYLALAMGLIRDGMGRLGIVTALKYSRILCRVAFGRTRLFSIKRPEAMKDTRALVMFLESSELLDSQRALVRVRG